MDSTRALRNQEELLAQIDEMDETLLRLREEAAMVPGLANAQRVAEASLVAQGEQISNLQALLAEKDTKLEELIQFTAQTETLQAEKRGSAHSRSSESSRD